MGRISELPEALLLKILSLMPTEKAVATMVLSKRWQFLWTMVPRLEYDHNMYRDGEDGRFLRFVYSSLLLHEAPVLESFSLKLGQTSGAVDVGVCVKPAITRSVRELNVEVDTVTETQAILPRSLYTGCRMLATLTLKDVVLVGASSPVSFPSLKTMSLVSVKYPGDEFVRKLLSGCPVLEDLFVVQCRGDNVTVLVVRVASLKYLAVRRSSEKENHQGLVIDAPSLEFLDIVDYTDGFCFIENSMPKIREAHLDVTYSQTQQLLGSLTSLSQLSLCLVSSMDAAFDGTIFSQLDQLKLCTCDPEWLNLLMRLLKASPKLRFIVLQQSNHCIRTEVPSPCWNKPSQVPECLLSSLESFNWRHYEGRGAEKELTAYILRNSRRLRFATFYPKSTDPVEKSKLRMELSKSPMSSSSCQLVFRGSYNRASR
ncbi:unnamed protein product [Thlaspi arvense]|uniref:FBD domain-containing protein n=1 Tax=Thlaspi arvense TaxID=13288 RepID=A0AAU9SRZ5_THLAR|nr:unnamed protein product [Thlaspi arvense]